MAQGEAHEWEGATSGCLTYKTAGRRSSGSVCIGVFLGYHVLSAYEALWTSIKGPASQVVQNVGVATLGLLRFALLVFLGGRDEESVKGFPHLDTSVDMKRPHTLPVLFVE